MSKKSKLKTIYNMGVSDFTIKVQDIRFTFDLNFQEKDFTSWCIINVKGDTWKDSVILELLLFNGFSYLYDRNMMLPAFILRRVKRLFRSKAMRTRLNLIYNKAIDDNFNVPLVD